MPTQFKVMDIRVLKVTYSFVGKKRKRKAEIASDLPAEIRCRSTYHEKKLLLNSIVGVSVQAPVFSLDVEVGGAFEFEKAPDLDELDKLRNINCPAIVFPFLREFVADLVRRGGFSSLLLPPVNFLKMYQNKKAEQTIEKQA